jgi:hypothetical protein
VAGFYRDSRGNAKMIAENFGVNWLEIDLPFPCEIHQVALRSIPRPDRLKVLFLSGEPAPLRSPPEVARSLAPYFDLLLTSDKSLLDLPNAEFFIYGDPWVNTPPTSKTFNLSFLHSPGDREWDGYLLRDEVWRVRKKVTAPHSWWFTSKNSPGITKFDQIDREPKYPYPKKDPLFESMFTLAIENVCELDFFTEKILDAFQTYTVPLYFGCINISDYFNTDGIILVKNEAEIIDAANSLTIEDYWSRLPAMLENKRKARNYQNGLQRIQLKIIDYVKRKNYVFPDA